MLFFTRFANCVRSERSTSAATGGGDAAAETERGGREGERCEWLARRRRRRGRATQGERSAPLAKHIRGASASARTNVQRIVRVRLREQDDEACDDRSQVEHGLPLRPENVEAHVAVEVDVRMEELRETSARRAPYTDNCGAEAHGGGERTGAPWTGAG